MKSKCLIILLFLFIYSCSENIRSKKEESIDDKSKRNENNAWVIDKETGKGRWVPVGKNNPIQEGIYTLFYFNGNIRETGVLTKGKKSDTTKYYNIKGNFAYGLIEPYKLTKSKILADGKHTLCYPKGELKEKLEFLNNKPINCHVFFDKNESITGKFCYGDSIDIAVRFYSNGQTKDSIISNKSKNQGTSFQWYNNGNLKHSGNFKNQQSEGQFEYFYKNGQLQQLAYFVNGKLDSTFIEYFENGDTSKLMYYKNGLENGIHKEFYQNGKLKVKANVLQDQQHGKSWFYHENGILESYELYNHGTLINSKYYDEDGNITE